MSRTSPEALPFTWGDGWPEPLPDSVVTLREAGIALGSLILEESEWQTLRSRPVLSLRVDDHPVTDGWTTHRQDGTEESVEFSIPLTAVVVPPDALAHGRAFSDWVMDTHGSLGRLLLWDETKGWWMVNDPDLELLLSCAPPGMFVEESDDLSWLPIGTDAGRQMVEALRARYGL